MATWEAQILRPDYASELESSSSLI